MTVFYLVRHAHAHWVPDENRPLSERGRKDATRVADILERCPIQVIYASPYCRAAQTIEPLAKRLHLPISTRSDLRERTLAGDPVDDFNAVVKTVWRDPTFAFAGGESHNVAQQRGIAVVQQLMTQHPTDHVILASHGTLLTLMLQHFDPTLGYDFWQALRMPDIYRLTILPNNQATFTQLWK